MADIAERLQFWQTVYPEDMDKDEGNLYEEARKEILELRGTLKKALAAHKQILTEPDSLSNPYKISADLLREVEPNWSGFEGGVGKLSASLAMAQTKQQYPETLARLKKVGQSEGEGSDELGKV